MILQLATTNEDSFGCKQPGLHARVRATIRAAPAQSLARPYGAGLWDVVPSRALQDYHGRAKLVYMGSRGFVIEVARRLLDVLHQHSL